MTSGEINLKVVTDRLTRFEEIAGFRNRLTHFYSDVTDEELFGIVTGQLGDLAAIAAALRGSAGRLARKGAEGSAAGWGA
ncbi:MAG: HepT-like ribonuclease domain-containing protein [Gemmatimonadota bacterium]